MVNKFFSEIKGNFGFGCMRLPMNGEDVDIEQTKKMVDAFLDSGFNYFDTAHGYINQKSELALRECLTSRYPRDKYILTNKLSGNYFNSEEDIIPLFNSQLEACGVDYFDFYLMHAQNARGFEKYKRCRAYETAFKLKEEGKVKHVGFSFHDRAEVLDTILNEYPQIEVVQIQFNYLDYSDPAVQSKLCYDVCVKHGVPCIIMEPVKGGTLIKLPEDGEKAVEKFGISKAELAIRFAASFDNNMMVLSGMSTIEQMEENIAFMKDFKPLTDEEYKLIDDVVYSFKALELIKCTSCRYCVEGCPMHISIPDLFSCHNTKIQTKSWNANMYYNVHTTGKGKASDCIKCGKCESICPQNLPIRELLVKVAEEFERR